MTVADVEANLEASSQGETTTYSQSDGIVGLLAKIRASIMF